MFWHKLCYWIYFFILWKCMLSKISGVFGYGCNAWLVFYFFMIIRHTGQQSLSQRGHKNRHFKHVYSHFVFCEMYFLKNLFWNKALENSSTIPAKSQNYLTLSAIYHGNRYFVYLQGRFRSFKGNCIILHFSLLYFMWVGFIFAKIACGYSFHY